MKRLETPNWQKNQMRSSRFRLFWLVGFLLIPLTVGGYYLGKTLIAEANISVTGATIFVRAGGNFQSALDRARAGDTIILQAGAEFTGSFTLPAKSGAEFITIQSSEIAKLPKDGMRVSPPDGVNMPKILSPGGGVPAIKTAEGAHHFRFVGIEIAPAGTDYVYNLVALGTDSQKAEEMPKALEFDRCYIHPNAK